MRWYPLDMPHAKLLSEILEAAEVAKASGDPLDIVFDLDSTIFCVSPRTEAILRLLATDEEMLAHFPEFTAKLAHLEANSKDWGIRGILERAQFTATLEFFELLRKKWSAHFFSSNHLHIDKPYPGAIEYLRALDKAGARIRYLTGRDAPQMKQGTLKTFRQWNIPLQDPSYLLMKPDTARHDAEFKRETLQSIFGMERPVWFFENEPVIINIIRKSLPKVKIIFIDSVHSGREEAPSGLPVIPMSYEIKSSK